MININLYRWDHCYRLLIHRLSAIVRAGNALLTSLCADTKEELPKPAVIVGKASKFLPPPIPVSCISDDRIAALQAGTRIDPRFWQVARLLSAKKRSEMQVYNNEHLPVVKQSTKPPGPTVSVASFHWSSGDFPALSSDTAPERQKHRHSQHKKPSQQKKRQPLGPIITDAAAPAAEDTAPGKQKKRNRSKRKAAVVPAKKENSPPVVAE